MREGHQRRLLQAQFSLKGHVSATARQKRASKEVITRACSQGRWHPLIFPVDSLAAHRICGRNLICISEASLYHLSH